MRRYSIIGEQNVPATAGSGQADSGIVATLNTDTDIRPHLYGVTFGCSDSTADEAWTIQLGRITTAGTATTITPEPLDPAEPASTTSGRSNYTGGPTVTANSEMLSVDLNQRATLTWLEDPERGFVIPATANSGIWLYFAVATGGTPLCHATMLFSE